MSFFGNLSTLFGNQSSTRQPGNNLKKKPVLRKDIKGLHKVSGQEDSKSAQKQKAQTQAQLDQSARDKAAQAQNLEQINREAVAKAREIASHALIRSISSVLDVDIAPNLICSLGFTSFIL